MRSLFNKPLKSVSLCGRPNVGKSSLFNRLTGRKKALVLDEPGVTRDVTLARVQINDLEEFELADLAGLELLDNCGKNHEKKQALQKLAYKAALEYLKRTDLILFVVDARAGVTSADHELARLVRKLDKDVLLVLAKVEGRVGERAVLEASEFGFDGAICTSAEHNLGIGDLKDAIVRKLDLKTAEETGGTDADLKHRGSLPENPIRLGVYGKPNVGKSTLVNALLGENRMITSPIPGTTVDTVDSDFKMHDKYYRILDTAGIRKRAKTKDGVEVLSVLKALRSLVDVDVALFIIDGFDGVQDQDEKIAGELMNSGRPLIVIINKWDICGVTKEQYAKRLRETVPFLDYAPVMFISALNAFHRGGDELHALDDLIRELFDQRMIVAPTPDLNRFFESICEQNNASGAKVYYASQISKSPPTFALRINDRKKFHFSYERFLRNELRKRYGWMGSPIRFEYRAKR